MLHHARGRGRARRERAARRRHAVDVVPPRRRGRGAERRALRARGRRRRGQARGRRASALRRGARAPRRRDPGDGPPRPDAAVGARDGRLQGAGARRGARPTRSSTTRRRSPRPASSRSCSRASRRTLAARITAEVDVPTIGIGAGAALRRPGARHPRPARACCPGPSPKFVRRYADVRGRRRPRRSGAGPTTCARGAFPASDETLRGARWSIVRRVARDEGGLAARRGRSGPRDRLRADDGRAARGPPVAGAARRERADLTVVSIFVNPTQFGPGEDLATLPARPRRATSDLLHRARASTSSSRREAEEIYPAGRRARSSRSRACRTRLEGASRPGHFRGVATVVLKLFEIVAPARRRVRPEGRAAGGRSSGAWCAT